ncbi:hypothetical protein CASFOL_017106 [Castilleja foliolosa]|uniref:Uncharacterized protein n=1 Tax=Castilleja foliolosa TaxID=1961234 RepID=A0ABD3DDE0_9LAMI
MIGFNLLLCFNLLFIISFISEANINAEGEYKVYIVYMGGLSTRNGAGINDHAQLLSELMDREKDYVVHTYNKSLLGFAARLSEEEAESIAQRSGVVSVFPDRVSQLQTTRSWDFLKYQGVAYESDDVRRSNNAESTQADTIIGIIDTGIWPEHPSFNDKYMGRIPPRWKGECASGINSTYSFKCNRKLIGARYYTDLDAREPIVTARDYYGHGTHVASIAAGMPVSGASYYGLAKGTARGGSRSSRIAMYRVCSPKGECYDSSILKAFDDAIADGVDVLSVSISGSYESLLTDPVAVGAFHAAEKGVTVVCSAGNDGPSPGTLKNDAPWVLTVAASTIDRDFEVDVVLGNHAVIKGGGINFSGLNKSAVYRLVDGLSPKANQTDNLAGTIVLCNVSSKCIEHVIDNQGVLGMIVMDDDFRQSPEDDAKYFNLDSFAIVTMKDGARILSYINSTRKPLATILSTRVIPNNYKPAPVVAYFSSRGPTKRHVNLLKPDIAAPGVGILGAWRMNDTSLVNPGKEPPLFNIMSGTSQACPHVSGLAANVKSWHPTWTPSAIRSAIMTTALQKNNLHAPITTINGTRATPYDIGAGEISLFGPFWPGLVYETQPSDYVQFLCNMGYNSSAIKSISSTVPSNFSCPSNSSPDLIPDMNYPSIVVSAGLKANGTRTVKRTVTNVGEERSIYIASVEAPSGVRVQVVPKILRFTKAVKKQSFQVIFTPTTTFNGTLFGSIIWSSNNNVKVRSPFAVIISNA